MFQSYDRVGATDILPHLAMEKAEIFIKKMDETIHWQIFVDSLSTNSWLLIIIVAMIISLLLSLVDGSLNVQYLGKLWIAIKANFGGNPGLVSTRNSYRIIIFDCLLVGSIVWIAYKASLTSKLAVVQQEYPFKNLQDLLESNYE